jgi:hypothetical protein
LKKWMEIDGAWRQETGVRTQIGHAQGDVRGRPAIRASAGARRAPECAPCL